MGSSLRYLQYCSSAMTEGKLYRENLKRFNPRKYQEFKERQKEACKRYRDRNKSRNANISANNDVGNIE